MRWIVIIPTGAVVAVTLCLAASPGPVEAQARRPVRAARAKPAKPAKLDIAALRRDLFGTDAPRAIAAAEALGKAQAEPQALEALLDALAMGLAPEVATAALDAVGAHKSPLAFDTLAFYLRYRDARVRAAAVRAVGALDVPRAGSEVLAALTDGDVQVRAAAITAVADRNLRPAIEPMLELLKKGDEATAPALARMADADLARALGEFIGVAPDALLARALGLTLARTDFGPEAARVQVVRALSKIPGPEVTQQLTTYVQATPAVPPRQSRREAEAILKDRAAGGN